MSLDKPVGSFALLDAFSEVLCVTDGGWLAEEEDDAAGVGISFGGSCGAESVLT